MRRGSRKAPLSDNEADLDWFFNDAPGAVSGLRSSWILMEGAGRIGAPESRAVPGHRLSAASRESDVASRLERLSSEDRIVLMLAFSRRLLWPIATSTDAKGNDYRTRLWSSAVRRFGERIAPLLPATEPARKAFVDLLEEKGRTKDDRELVFDVEAIDGRDAAWRRGEDPRGALVRLVRRGFADWLYSDAREDDRPEMLREARADARLALRRALSAWTTVCPSPGQSVAERSRERRRGAMSIEFVRPSSEPIDILPPAWEPAAAE